jgi:hypothetical protein
MPAPGPSDPNTVATLYFTMHGIILNTRQPNDGRVTEYAIDPRSLTDLFSVQEPPPPARKHSTGILLPSTICMTMCGDATIIVDYREPQITGIWFAGNPQPLQVPMPGLLLIGKSTNGKHRSYSMYAVKERPTDMTCKLYEVPLVHASHGSMCWGNVQIDPEENPNSLANAWPHSWARHSTITASKARASAGSTRKTSARCSSTWTNAKPKNTRSTTWSKRV